MINQYLMSVDSCDVLLYISFYSSEMPVEKHVVYVLSDLNHKLHVLVSNSNVQCN